VYHNTVKPSYVYKNKTLSPAAVHGDAINKVSGHHLFWGT